MKPVVLLTGGAALLLAGTAWAAPAIAGPETARAVLTAAVICVTAGWLAMLVPVLIVPRHPDYAMQAGLAAMLIRLFLTLAAGWVCLTYTTAAGSAFSNAMVAWYLILLFIETWMTVRLVNRHWRPPASADGLESTTK